MNRPRDEFFPRAALTQDQYGIAMLGDFLNQLINALHSRWDTDQSSKTRPAAKLFAQQTVFLVEFDRTHQTFQLGPQFLDVERLCDIVYRPEPCRLDRRFDGAILREHDDRNLRIARANP